MLREAVRRVHQNAVLLLIYIAIDGPLSLALAAINEFYLDPRKEQLGERVLGIVFVAELVIVVFINALLFSVMFSYLARELDRPLWKFYGTTDAIARFFPMWLVLFFAGSAMLHVAGMLQNAGNDSASQLLSLAWIGTEIVTTPFGAMVVFLGNGNGEDLRTAVTNLLPRILDRFFLATFLGLIQTLFVISLAFDPETAFWMQPLIGAVRTYIYFILFAYIFLACREQRDLEEPQDPYDF